MSVSASNGKTVLITGVNGYIASALGNLLLTKGYSLRGTTRRLVSTEALLKGPWAPYQERIKIYEVPDMTVSGAFDEAANGVHGIFHTASPIDFSIKTYEKMIIPAVKGSETILASAIKAGPQLTSVVVTSSVAAVTNPKEGPYTFTEADFASASLDRATKEREDGVQTPVGILYSASKTAAERAVWKFRDEHKPSFAITTINPSVVIGPPVVVASSPEKLNATLRPLFDVLSGAAKTIGPNIGTGFFVDVRDVAFMHIWAYENPSKADGERYIAAAGFGPLQAVADVLRYRYKGTAIGEKILLGNPGQSYIGYDKQTGEVKEVMPAPNALTVSGEKAKKEMGVKWVTFPQSIVDTAKVLEVLL